MSRSSPKKEDEAAVLSPIEFHDIQSTTFCISSKEREPIEQLLPCIGGHILILASYDCNESGIYEAAKKGDKKEITIVKVHSIAQIQIILKRPGFDTLFHHFIVDRVDMIDNKKDKKHKAAQVLAMMNTIPPMMKKTNLFVTTMMGIPVLYDNVQKHIVV